MIRTTTVRRNARRAAHNAKLGILMVLGMLLAIPLVFGMLVLGYVSTLMLVELLYILTGGP